jgi:Xaa-Pro aminopeptidase
MDLKIKEITKAAHVKKNHAEAILQFLKPYVSKGYKVGIDERGISTSNLEQIKQTFPPSRIQLAYSVLQEIRMIKNDGEIETLRKCVYITEDGIKAALSISKEGITEQEMALEFEKTIAIHGAQRAYTVINFGSQGAYGALRPTNRALQKGDIIRFDIGVRYRHYYSDIGRTFAFGEPSAKHRKYYAALLEGQNEALELVRDGVLPRELFNKSMETARRAGIPHYKRHGIGHGIGLEFYDPPLINPDTNITVQEGMVLDIELPYYELGLGGLMVEDELVVKRSGYELLTQSSRELEIL